MSEAFLVIFFARFAVGFDGFRVLDFLAMGFGVGLLLTKGFSNSNSSSCRSIVVATLGNEMDSLLGAIVCVTCGLYFKEIGLLVAEMMFRGTGLEGSFGALGFSV